MSASPTDLEGFRLLPGVLSREQQEALRDAVFARLKQAPLFIPRMP